MGHALIRDRLVKAVVVGMSEIAEDQGGSSESTLKTTDGTLVTPTDKRSEKAMLESLSGIPNVSVRFEESDTGASSHRMVILGDPLDGTGAFANGLATSTAIAALYDTKVKRLRACAVGEAATGRIWYCDDDSPTYLVQHLAVGTKASPRVVQIQKDPLRELGPKDYVFMDVSHGFKNICTNLQMGDLLDSLTLDGVKIHIPGSNGLIQALVANGANSAAGSISTAKGGPWDFCGSLLVRQSGGVCRGFRKQGMSLVVHDPLDPVGCDILVTAKSEKIADYLCDQIKMLF